MKNYGFEPFETVIALITTQYISDHVSRTELGILKSDRTYEEVLAFLDTGDEGEE